MYMFVVLKGILYLWLSSHSAQVLNQIAKLQTKEKTYTAYFTLYKRAEKSKN